MNHNQQELYSELNIDNIRQQMIGIETKVPLLDGKMHHYINLDNAASTPVMKPVLDTLIRFMDWYSSVHRGSGVKSQVATHAYEEAHDIAMRFVGANPDTHTVIFGKNATDSLNKIARRFPFKSGNVVLTTMMEHHSNDLPWRKVAHVEHINVKTDGSLDEGHMDILLKQFAGRVKLVVVTGAANVTGFINPIHRIARKVHQAGAMLLVDAAQLAPHRAINMGEIDDSEHIDFLITAAHKMYAPFGSSCLFGPKAIFEDGDPDVVGGGTVEIVTVNTVKWAGLPDREEPGSPNVPGAVAQASAMLCLQKIGMDRIAAHEAQLTAYALRKLKNIPRLKIYGSDDPDFASERVGVIPFNIEGMSHYLVSAILSAEGGIGVRNGCFCAHPYLFSLLGLSEAESLAYRNMILEGSKAKLPGLVRISFGCYNNESDIDQLIAVLERIVRQEYKGKYVQDIKSGSYWPQGFSIQPHSFFQI